MAQLVTLMMASRSSSISGSETVSQRMSSLPCQTSAFMSGTPLRTNVACHRNEFPRRVVPAERAISASESRLARLLLADDLLALLARLTEPDGDSLLAARHLPGAGREILRAAMVCLLSRARACSFVPRSCAS